jgi:hypothetical protein
VTLFDDPPAITESEARDRGMAIAADTNKSVLDLLRESVKLRYRALASAGIRDWVSADDARELFEIGVALGAYERPASMNFLGSLFKCSDWEWTGEFHKSATSGSHQNRLMKWRYIGA